MPKVGRNDPCPCGSGKKFKQCCGRPQSVPRVLYIHPAKQAVGHDPGQGAVGRPYGLMPVGVAGLVNVLQENGIRVTGLNYPMETKLDPAFDLSTRVLSLNQEHGGGAF